MKMMQTTTAANDIVVRKKTGHHAKGNHEETRVKHQMTATVRGINADIDHATGLMTRHGATDPLTGSVDRPRIIIEPVTAATEIGMMRGIDIVASIGIVDMMGGVSGLDHEIDFPSGLIQKTGPRIASMKSPPEVGTNKSVAAVIGKSHNSNFILYIFVVCILIGTVLTAIHQAAIIRTITTNEVIISVVTNEVVTRGAVESTIVERTMKGESDVRGISRMIWPRIHTFRKRTLTTAATTIPSSREKVRKVRATYFGTASNGCLDNVRRPTSTLCRST